MSPSTRREFLSGLGETGALLAAGPWLSLIGYAQTTRAPARVFLRRSPARADFGRRVLGAFLEHLGRAVYTGVFEPGSPLADGIVGTEPFELRADSGGQQFGDEVLHLQHEAELLVRSLGEAGFFGTRPALS